MACALKTVPINESYRHGFRYVCFGHHGRRKVKRQTNRRFRHQFDQQLRAGRIEAWTDFQPRAKARLTMWDIC
jgi:hypothetical protein